MEWQSSGDLEMNKMKRRESYLLSLGIIMRQEKFGIRETNMREVDTRNSMNKQQVE